MKYGEQLEQESVPEWSLHNVDYNSLKHEIKVHTSRDQATAITIPGHQDAALKRFEDNLYNELCIQHDRVDLFVTSKADEISRRLQYISDQVQKLIVKCAEEGDRVSLKRHRRFAKYERDLLRCGEDTLALARFINAQITAFRKITKKYKKWTGSPTLGARFRENVLANPKSFTRRDFNNLQARYEELLNTLRTSTPQLSEPSSPSSDEQPPTPRRGSEVFTPLPPAEQLPRQPARSQQHYWNEYDDGSEAGGPDDEYAIYVNPDEDMSFPGLDSMRAILAAPFRHARRWFSGRQNPEGQRLLGNGPLLESYGGISPLGTDTDDEYASSDGMPQNGYAAHYALPSINQQQVVRYRERVLSLGTIGCFAVSFLLLLVAGILITTGRHKQRVEVDAGVTVGVVASLFLACIGLGMSLYRRDDLGILQRGAVYSSFLTACVLNGMLLILVVGNAA
ncbi:Vacuolar transporter chaperone 4-like protein 2 [Colletotrichum chlorophyti]|uniref:Vacuolar transporter chaperone 4-like protein 2 n=1 Tax=Colletotrichum chlorophyti TaxID=708187 RepID=A0A1Q8RMJ0_9PEZI|nr:Vacuolar transporter chaperone 4-like protein 2 [Colletotrichum chlorophyti]